MNLLCILNRTLIWIMAGDIYVIMNESNYKSGSLTKWLYIIAMLYSLQYTPWIARPLWKVILMYNEFAKYCDNITRREGNHDL